MADAIAWEVAGGMVVIDFANWFFPLKKKVFVQRENNMREANNCFRATFPWEVGVNQKPSGRGHSVLLNDI